MASEEENLPIIALPEEYSVDGERLGIALAHVSAQTYHLAETQAGLQERQSCHEQEQLRFVEERVAAARLEAEARNNALVLVIRQAYGDPTTLELRVDARIQRVLAQLQETAQQQARAIAETHLADQAAAQQLVQHRMNTELQRVQAQIDERTEERINSLFAGLCQQQDTTAQELRQAAQERADLLQHQALAGNRDQQVLQRAEKAARSIATSQRSMQLSVAVDAIQAAVMARIEAHVVELVQGFIARHENACMQHQRRDLDEFRVEIDQRFLDVVAVAKKAAETKARQLTSALRRGSALESTPPSGDTEMPAASNASTDLDPTQSGVTQDQSAIGTVAQGDSTRADGSPTTVPGGARNSQTEENPMSSTRSSSEAEITRCSPRAAQTLTTLTSPMGAAERDVPRTVQSSRSSESPTTGTESLHNLPQSMHSASMADNIYILFSVVVDSDAYSNMMAWSESVENEEILKVMIAGQRLNLDPVEIPTELLSPMRITTIRLGLPAAAVG
ncbi:hypothetical protein BBJ28_00006413, partial [Nothophytophthora sp. Chile5]